MNRRTLILGASALGLIAFGGGAFYINRQRVAEAEAVATAAAAAPPADESVLIRSYSPVLGPAEAKVTLVEFFDPFCEACRAFHPVLKELQHGFLTSCAVVMRYIGLSEGSDEAVRMVTDPAVGTGCRAEGSVAWKARFGGMEVSGTPGGCGRSGDENGKLKRSVLVRPMLDNRRPGIWWQKKRLVPQFVRREAVAHRRTRSGWAYPVDVVPDDPLG